jgi:hypothetical protein
VRLTQSTAATEGRPGDGVDVWTGVYQLQAAVGAWIGVRRGHMM